MRLSAVLLLLPGLAWAEDFVLPTDVSAVTVYARGAEIVRSSEVALPPGTHRLLLPMPQADAMIGAPRLAASAVSVGAVEQVEALPLSRDELLTPNQAAADSAVSQAEARADDARDRAARIEGQVEAAEARLRFIRTVAMPAEFEAGADIAAAVTSLSQAVGAQVAQAASEIVRLRGELREAREALEEANAALKRAQRALEELGPLGESPAGLVATVTAEAEVTARVEVTYLSGAASWAPEYEMRLDTEAEALELTRLAALRQFTGETWRGVALVLSTADPGRGAAPTEVYPAPASISPEPPAPSPTVRRSVVVAEEAEADFAGAVAAPAPVEAMAIAEGLSLRYAYPDPVRVSGGGERTVLKLGTLEMEPDLSNRAAPRFDDTAYLVAEVENDTGETILPGQAAIYRDGDFVGRTGLGQWAAGDARDIAFGPVDTLRLEWTVLRRGSGDGGIINRVSTRDVRARFTVRNTGGEDETVRALYALPFSEQEDLQVSVSAEPRPAETDVDGRRGVSAWVLDVPAGGEVTVNLLFELDWPEGQVLNWRP